MVPTSTGEMGIQTWVNAQAQRSILRFITCGSVDDGKSTLIGRLLYESKRIFDDQLKALETDSKQYGTQGEKLDLALLVDGLQAEREQGITIDVAYRFFATDYRRFIVADTPGHEQYTRNMATGASTASLAVILVDARKGILTQTKRHSLIVSLMGIRHIVLAVNKMDLMHYDSAVFQQIVSEYERFAETHCDFNTIQAIPMSALAGHNVIARSAMTPWYEGPSLIDYLETVDVDGFVDEAPFRMPVQWVNRPNLDFRGFCGRIASGDVKPGDRVCVLPSGRESHVQQIISGHQAQEQAQSGDSITLTLMDELDISRGDVIVAAAHPAQVANQFEARLLWMSDNPLTPGRSYLVKIHSKELTATITDIQYLEDINTGGHLTAKKLALNEIAVVHISFSQPVAFEPYAINRTLGAFILIDRLTFETLGAGMINFALRRASDNHWQTLEVDKQARAAMKHQNPYCIWFTGLAGTGKSIIAKMLEKRLYAEGKHTYLLNREQLLRNCEPGLVLTETDPADHIARMVEMIRVMIDAGLIVLVASDFSSQEERKLIRSSLADSELIEVLVDQASEIDEEQKGPQPGNFSHLDGGVDSSWELSEMPEPEVHIHNRDSSVEACVEQILDFLNCKNSTGKPPNP